MRLEFLGKMKMEYALSRVVMIPPGSNRFCSFVANDFSYHKAEEEFMHHTWNFVPKRSADTLSTNNYEWPFSLTIPGTAVSSPISTFHATVWRVPNSGDIVSVYDAKSVSWKFLFRQLGHGQQELILKEPSHNRSGHLMQANFP